MRGEVGTEPALLGRAGIAAAHVDAFAVEDDDVPGSQLIAVITGSGVASGSAKIVEIGSGGRGVELMIARGRARAGLHASPGLVVAGEIFFAAVGIGQVTDGDDGAGNLLEEFGGGFRSGKVAAIGDVAGADENGDHLRSLGVARRA